MSPIYCVFVGRTFINSVQCAYSCNDYEKTTSVDENAKSALGKYLFHFDRYNNHLNSLKIEAELTNSINEKRMAIAANPQIHMTFAEVSCCIGLMFLCLNLW